MVVTQFGCCEVTVGVSGITRAVAVKAETQKVAESSSCWVERLGSKDVSPYHESKHRTSCIALHGHDETDGAEPIAFLAPVYVFSSVQNS